MLAPFWTLKFQIPAYSQRKLYFNEQTMTVFRGVDLSLRAFDIENGMMLIAPMEDMECDKLARHKEFLVARCGQGQAILVLKYTDGAEDFEEVDFIDL